MLSINKSYLLSLSIKDDTSIKKISNILFLNDIKLNKDENNGNIFDNIIIKSIIKHLFYYNETTGLITLNKNVLNYISSGNLKNFLTKEINIAEILFQQPPSDFDNIILINNF